MLLDGCHLGGAQQGSHSGALVGCGDRDDGPGVPGTARASRPVDVGLVLGGRVDMDDEGDVIDVDPAGRDVGRDEHSDLSAVEGVQVAGACVLRQVRVQVETGDTCIGCGLCATRCPEKAIVMDEIEPMKEHILDYLGDARPQIKG